jgi:hypothetical protein
MQHTLSREAPPILIDVALHHVTNDHQQRQRRGFIPA